MYKLDDLQKKKVSDLKDIASKLNLKKFEKLNKTNLIYKILDEQANNSSKENTENKTSKKIEKFTKKNPNQELKEENTKKEIKNKKPLHPKHQIKKEENIKPSTIQKPNQNLKLKPLSETPTWNR